MKLKENLELLVAFLTFRDKLNLAARVAYMLELFENHEFKRAIIECRALGLSKKEIRTLIWEARYNSA